LIEKMFRRGIRKRKKRLYKIVSSISRNGETYIWRCKVSPELRKALIV
jgi:hypothetical protein